VIAPHNLKKATHINNLKLNLHAQKNPISAQVVGGSGLSPPRASIGTLCLSLSVSVCVSTLFPDDDRHDRKSHTAAAAKIRASTPIVFLEFWLHLKLSQPCYLPKEENTASRRIKWCNSSSSSSPKPLTLSVSLSFGLSLLICVSLFSISVSVSVLRQNSQEEQLPQDFGMGTYHTNNRILPIQVCCNSPPSLPNQRSVSVSLSVPPSVSVCLSVCLLLSVSLFLCLCFGFSYVILQLLSRFLFSLCGPLSVSPYWFLCFCEFLCFGFITQFFATCCGDLVEDLTSLMDFRDYPTSLRARLLTRGRELCDKSGKNLAKQN
jgi:hypothetical protein